MKQSGCCSGLNAKKIAEIDKGGDLEDIQLNMVTAR